MPFVTNDISGTMRGITWTIKRDGSFTANGEISGGESFITIAEQSIGIQLLEKNVDYYGIIISNDNAARLQIIQYKSQGFVTVFNSNCIGNTFKIDNDATGVWIRLQVPANIGTINSNGSVGIVKASEIDYNLISNLINKENIETRMDLIADSFYHQGDEIVVTFDKLLPYKIGSYIDANLNIVDGAQHSVMIMPAVGISTITFNINENPPYSMGYILHDDVKIPLDYHGTLSCLIPDGLPADALVFINWFYANTDTKNKVSSSMIVKYANHDSRIKIGKNKFDASTAIMGAISYYEDGDFTTIGGQNYALNAFSVSPGDIMRIIANDVTSHVVFMDKYGKFISGALGQNIQESVVPENAYICAISFRKTTLGNAMVTLNDTDTTYEPFYYYISEKDNSSFDPGYLPYQEGYIYRDFDVPQKPIFDGTTYKNTAYLKLPANYNETGIPTPFVVIVHGASAGISSDGSTGWTYNTYYNNIVTALINAGYAVMDSNGFNNNTSPGHDHWSCPQALSGYVQAYDYFTSHYNLNKLTFVYGFSMGGLTALNLAVSDMFPIRCLMIGAPAVSIYNQCVERPTDPNPNFLAAYDITEYDKTKIYGCDRYQDVITINDKKMVFGDYPPLFIAYGESDVNISNQHILDYFEGLYNTNHYVRIKSYTGGHEISYGGSQDVITDLVNYFNGFRDSLS